MISVSDVPVSQLRQPPCGHKLGRTGVLGTPWICSLLSFSWPLNSLISVQLTLRVTAKLCPCCSWEPAPPGRGKTG